MRMIVFLTLMALLFAAALPTTPLAAAPTDRVALKGVRTGKAVFDVNVTDAEKLSLYLQVITETLEGLKTQGVRPEMVVAFRGAAVRFVSTDRKSFSADTIDALAEADALIAGLAKQGVRFEACAIATRLFKVDNATILPQVSVVANTFISLVGYQARGYALVPIY
ncbi:MULTISPECIES: DsrE family protein [Geobacter]|uniref:DsrE family protein n=1 Tax=Geobacter TaxID=28231 RepID=UPI0025730589|nr:DsrE family protein [Geobacter sulfurreducens]BEH11242.1 hypothetical protein GSUET_28540 [Geobacter sulfurreducens subsp. ethanolicus]BET59090.1 hypothetical protein GEO60473_21300 [Geobacter sp. 60473]HML79299.1 DsrE family protein [Geobacter sulfurreducens]